MPFLISRLLTISVDLYSLDPNFHLVLFSFCFTFDPVCGIGRLATNLLGFSLPRKCLYLTFILKVAFGSSLVV